MRAPTLPATRARATPGAGPIAAAPPSRRALARRAPADCAATSRPAGADADAADLLTRRAALAVVSTALAPAWSGGAAAAVDAAPVAAAPSAMASPPASPTPPPLLGDRLDAPGFSVSPPRGYDIVLLAAAPGSAPASARERGERGRGVAPADSPVKVRCVSPGGDAELTVIAREASGIKPTFLQVTDLSQWGDVATVAGLLLPRGVRVLASATQVVAQPDRDTGTVAGVVPTPPQTVYRYEFEGRDGLRVTLAAVARAGRVFLVAGTARAAAWPAEAAALRAAVSSFRLVG